MTFTYFKSFFIQVRYLFSNADFEQAWHCSSEFLLQIRKNIFKFGIFSYFEKLGLCLYLLWLCGPSHFREELLIKPNKLISVFFFCLNYFVVVVNRRNTNSIYSYFLLCLWVKAFSICEIPLASYNDQCTSSVCFQIIGSCLNGKKGLEGSNDCSLSEISCLRIKCWPLVRIRLAHQFLPLLSWLPMFPPDWEPDTLGEN